MIKILKQTESFKGKYYSDGSYLGDFVYADDYLLGNFNKDLYKKDFFQLEHVSVNTFSALEEIGVDVSYFDNFKYKCPFTGNKYFSVIPVIIVSDNISKYKDFFKHQEMALDVNYNRKEFNEKIEPEELINSIMKFLIGPGYTISFYPSDGSIDLSLSTLQLDNGDVIVCVNNVWFNK